MEGQTDGEIVVEEEQQVKETSPGCGGKFMNSYGTTWYKDRISENGMTKLFNFSMKNTGNIVCLSDSIPGKWMLELETKSSIKKNEYQKCTVSLDSQCFRSRDNFARSLDQQCPNMFLILDAGLSVKILSEYVAWLENEYCETTSRTYFSANYIGYQPAQRTWVLSNQIQIKDGKIVPELEREFILDSSCHGFNLDFNKDLLDKTYLNRVWFKILTAANAFANNETAFVQALSFAVMRLWKITDNGVQAADESKYCCIRSISKSIGKTKALNLIAYASGISSIKHKFFIAGGNGVSTGSTVRKQELTLSYTNQIVIINEMSLGNTISNTLANAHDGMSSGSMSSGEIDCKASALGSSNSRSHESVEGRFLYIDFEKGEFNEIVNDLLTNELQPLMKSNLGAGIAWVCLYGDSVKRFLPGILVDCHKLICKYVVKRQWRLTRAIAGNLLFIFMLHITSNVNFDERLWFHQVTKAERPVRQESFKEKFIRNWKALLEDNELLTWLNPLTMFTDNDDKECKSVSIRNDQLSKFVDITLEELKEFLKNYGSKCWNVYSWFGIETGATLEDLKDKTKRKKIKSYKIPYEEIPSEFANELRKACGLKEVNLQVLDESFNVPKQLTEEDAFELSSIVRSLKCHFRVRNNQVGNDDGDEVSKTLTPISRKCYSKLDESGKRIAAWGIEIGEKKSKRRLILSVKSLKELCLEVLKK